MKTNKLLIVDGHAMLFRFFWGMPARIIGKDGKSMHGAYGMTSAIIYAARKFSPSQIVVCFDPPGPPKKQELLSDYKGNRKTEYASDDEDNPFPQLAYLYPALEFLGIPWVEIDEVEADELIGTLAEKASSEEMESIILSHDQDFFQLINEGTTMFNKRGKTEILWTVAKVNERLGVPPRQVVDFKALTGDPSDNLPGIPRIGAKTAARLLNEFDSAEAIFEGRDGLSLSLRQNIEEHWSRFLKVREVIRIRSDHDVALPTSGFESCAKCEKYNVRQVFQEAGLF